MENIPLESKTILEIAFRPQTILGKPPLHGRQSSLAKANVSGAVSGIVTYAFWSLKAHSLEGLGDSKKQGP